MRALSFDTTHNEKCTVSNEGPFIRYHTQRKNEITQLLLTSSHEWSFRRFTYGNLVTTLKICICETLTKPHHCINQVIMSVSVRGRLTRFLTILTWKWRYRMRALSFDTTHSRENDGIEWGPFHSIPHTTKNEITQLLLTSSHEWSFRRFTYGNLVTTSPSSKW